MNLASWRAALWAVLGLSFLYTASAGWDAALLALTPFLLFAAITVAHELGHFTAAHLVGHTVFEVAVGMGPVVVDRTSGPTHYVLRLLPIGGAVASSSTDTSGYRAKRFTIVAAGPLVNALIFGSGIVLHTRSGGVWHELAFLNGLVLLENLVPYRVRTPYGKQATDGLALLRLLRSNSDAGADEAAALAWMMQAERARAAGDPDGARHLIDQGLARYPHSRPVRSWLGTDLIMRGDYAEARACYLALLDEADLEPAQDAVYRNNLAWADLMVGDPGLLPEAVQQSGLALDALPKVDSIRGTRGYALIESGAVADGLALSRWATARHRDPRAKALTACVCAIGHARQWQHDEARRYLGMAAELDPTCRLLDRARAEVAQRDATRVPGAPRADT